MIVSITNKGESMIKKIIAVLLITLPLSALAGKLLKCEGVMTNSGYKYVGTYCMDFNCTYVQRFVFSSYCPYSV
jgi:hypothetical protein